MLSINTDCLNLIPYSMYKRQELYYNEVDVTTTDDLYPPVVYCQHCHNTNSRRRTESIGEQQIRVEPVTQGVGL